MKDLIGAVATIAFVIAVFGLFIHFAWMIGTHSVGLNSLVTWIGALAVCGSTIKLTGAPNPMMEN